MIEYADHMRSAIQLAKSNPAAPFAAILVDMATDEVAAKGVNRSNQNPTWHGEMIALAAYAATGQQHWDRLRLFTTAEPCCMCQAAVLWARIPEVVFGTSIATLRKLGWHQFDCTAADVAALASFTRCTVVGGILSDECDRLFEQAR